MSDLPLSPLALPWPLPGISCVRCFSLNVCLLLEILAFPSFLEQCSFFTLKNPSHSLVAMALTTMWDEHLPFSPGTIEISLVGGFA